MARQLDPNGQSLYARFSRYLSEGDDRLDQDMIREVDASPAVHDPEPVPPSAPFPPVAEGVKTRHTRVATVAYQLIAMLLTAAISLLLIWTTAKHRIPPITRWRGDTWKTEWKKPAPLTW